jgi:hypothetical protein
LVITDRSPSTSITVIYGLPIDPFGCPAIALGVEIAMHRNGMRKATRESVRSQSININQAESPHYVHEHGESVG